MRPLGCGAGEPFAPSTLELLARHDIFDGGFPVRNAFQKSPDGSLFLLTQYMLYSVEERGPRRLPRPDKQVCGGGPAIGDRLYFIHGQTRIGSIRL